MEEHTGIVLAGGRSDRFEDGDKALARIDGEPLLGRVVERVGRATDRVVVSCRDEQRDTFERVCDGASVPVQFVVDPVPDGGPLAGLSAALDVVETPFVAVVACDMPGVDPAFLDALFEYAAGCDGAVPTLRDGHLQPLQAVYRATVLQDAIEACQSYRNPGPRTVIERLDVRVLSPDEVAAVTDWRSLRNVNTVAELEQFRGGREWSEYP